MNWLSVLPSMCCDVVALNGFSFCFGTKVKLDYGLARCAPWRKYNLHAEKSMDGVILRLLKYKNRHIWSHDEPL